MWGAMMIKLIQKVIAVVVGMVVIVCIIDYWDTRRAEIACDAGQYLSELCQRQPFIDADRAKSVFQRNEIAPNQ
jgi:hypothetical protein